MATEQDPLNPAGVEFHGVSPLLARLRLIGAALTLLVPAVVLAVMGFVLQPWLYLPAGLLAAVFLWQAWLIPRQVRAIAYATTDTDFLVRRGIMFRRLDVVPYGRIQYVDVQEGPIARPLGIASVQLHTASAGTDASLDGLPSQQAADLRDLLMKLGSDELSGL